MDRYHDTIRAHLDHNQPNYGGPEIHSLLEMLCRYYREFNPVSGESIRDRLGDLRQVLNKLPPEDSEALFETICALCGEIERPSFREGLRMGLRLMTEISD